MSERIRLGEIIDVASGQVDPRTAPYCDLPHIGGDNIESDGGQIFGIRTARELSLISGKYEFGPGDVLYSKIRPALNKVALPDFKGICSADIYPLRPRNGRVERRYLAHLLRHDDFLSYAERHSTRTNIPKINREALLAYEIALPPIHEQCHVADILDKADAIRRKRKEAIALTEELLHSTFLEMFGDPVTNPKRWPVRTFKELLAIPLRNGLSPASGGTYAARVLTLSAITGRTYDPSASKEAMFAVEPWEDVRVDQRDFLICRGNGNKDLVGRGMFPVQSDRSLVFPDTMIAARIEVSAVARAFLATCWNSKHVRRQLESGARTTNGTFKINQSVVEAVQIIYPPRDIQDRFQQFAACTMRAIERLHDAALSSDRLFQALVTLAFANGAADVEAPC